MAETASMVDRCILERPNKTKQRHLLCKELTQALGLAKDSERYPQSIFQQSWTSTTEYPEIDEELVRLLYHPSLRADLDASQLEELLTEILMAESSQ
ncbi:MAG: hypothetical protein ACI9DJ_001925 [Algoriphagus sp.]|jgi:hypothetical protein